MADSTSQTDLTPANELVSLAEVDIIFERIILDARYALSWCHENDFDALARPLKKALDQTIGYTIQASNNIGEAGFELDEHNRIIFFSFSAVNAVIASSISFSGIKSKNPLDNPIVQNAIAIYLFHELTHISQKFVEHSQAKELQEAFGKDIFSMLDCITDIKAAHCVTVMLQSASGQFSKHDYVTLFSSNVTLAYHLLIDAFSIKNADHKRKRALGLISTCAICDVALEAEPLNKSALMATAMTPVFSSYSATKKRITCLAPESGDIVFVSPTQRNSITAEEIWKSLENIPLSEVKIFLKASFAGHLITKQGPKTATS